MLKRISMIAGAALLALSLAGSVAAADGDVLHVAFTEQSDSGITGTAILVEQGGKTTVTVDLVGASTTVEQPSHIHAGTCADLDPAPTYPLNNVVQGSAETTIDAPIATLLASPFAINVHKSSEEIAVYVACADLVSTGLSAQVMPATGAAQADSDSNAGVLAVVAAAGLMIVGTGLFVRRRHSA